MTFPLRFLDGETRLIGLIGDPVRQVRATWPLTEKLQAAGINALVMPMHLTSSGLDDFVAAMKAISNVDGFIFTVPHKIAALAFADQLSPLARAAGSMNVLRREHDGLWLGHMLDGMGFVSGLKADGYEPAGMTVFIAGAGGVGSAIAASLASAGASAFRLYDPDTSRARALARRLARDWPAVSAIALETADPAGADIAVNATPLGMRPDDPLPFAVAETEPHALVAEVVMKPAVTRLIDEARAAGRRVALGENVLFHQLDLMTGFFAGEPLEG